MGNKTIFPGEAPKIPLKVQQEIFKLIKEDSILPIHIQANGKAKKPSEFRKILLTGVTGHLGPYLLQQLSQQDSLTHIFCMIRAKSIEHAKERVLAKLKENSILNKTNLSKVFYILGDVAENNLGLDQETYNYLTVTIDAVIHNAVFANHTKSYPLSPRNEDPRKNQFRAVNITGVKNILEFSVTGVTKHILHSSSFCAVNRLDPVDGRLVEELPEEDNLGDGIFWGYACSKFVGEKLMKTALEQRGIPVTIIRYPTISGDSKTGFVATMDNLTALVSSFWSCGLCYEDNMGSCLCPVDICALITRKLLFTNDASTGVYNLSLPHSITINGVCEMGLRNGYEMVKLPYKEYVQTIFNDKKEFNPIMMTLKKIYSKKQGPRELFHSCPALRLGWYEPTRLSGTSAKLENCIPGYQQLMPSFDQCLKSMFVFFKKVDSFSQLQVKNLKTGLEMENSKL